MSQSITTHRDAPVSVRRKRRKCVNLRLPPEREIEYRRVRFKLSREYLRGVAKLAFHYFLWVCPWIGGDEPEFQGIRVFRQR